MLIIYKGTCHFFLLIIVSILVSASAYSETAPTKDLGTMPKVVKKLLMSLPESPTGKDFYASLDENLWDVYIESTDIKSELIEYIKHGKNEPAVAFSAVALITFRDPNAAISMIDRALDKNIANATRWYLLNAAPNVLSMGDVWYRGKGELDDDALDFIKHIKEQSETSVKKGIGNAHAQTLIKLYDEKKYPKDKNPELGLAKWHQSAYLIGTISLKDYELLEELIDHKQGAVYFNIITSLNYETNRDFVAELRGKKSEEITEELEVKIAGDIKNWWRRYAEKYPNGDWGPAVISGFKEAGYDINFDKNSSENTIELLRAIESNEPIYIYNACRVLNHIFKKQFDLERIFLGKKYALSPFDPSSKMKGLQKQLVTFWKNELNGK